MNDLNEFTASFWAVMNYPIIKIGSSSITLSAIFLNLMLILFFLIISSKIKNWLIRSIDQRPGVNIANWRAAITLSYYVLLIIGLIGILQTTGLDLSLFTVLTGAIGIGVGFGMQSIFANFIGGVIILIEKPLKLGDRIEVGTTSGNVQNISVRATTILTNDNVSIIVPNSDFISKEVINWSTSGNKVRLSISVGVSYDSDPSLVEKLLLDVAAAQSGVLKAPAPVVRLTDFGESGLNFSLLVWTQEFSDSKGALKSLLNFGVLKIFKENNIRIPYPQRDIHIHNANDPKQTNL